MGPESFSGTFVDAAYYAGAPTIITRNGRPIAQIAPLTPAQQDREAHSDI